MEKLLLIPLLIILAFTESRSQENEVAGGRKTENLIIVTLDGFRWREVFEGADKNILFRDKYVKDETVRTRFWEDNLKERRVKLMPFLWNVVAKKGQLYGNVNHGNQIRCTNSNLYSYSGYSEMFVGFADRRIKNNASIENPNYSVLEYINNHEDYLNSVAIFSTWGVIPQIFRESKSGLFINSGSDKSLADNRSVYEETLNKLTDENRNPYGERYDLYTFGYAFEFLKRERPRVMFVSLDETDEHGHGKRYGSYLKSAHRSDSLIAEMWRWIQTDPQYRGKTTLMVTTDHGRGTSAKGFQRHAMLLRGSAQIWLAVIGPDTPATGEMKDRVCYGQNQIAKTIAEFLQLPYTNVRPVGHAIPTVIRAPGKCEQAEEIIKAEAE
jgi:hypothetical protein